MLPADDTMLSVVKLDAVFDEKLRIEITSEPLLSSRAAILMLRITFVLHTSRDLLRSLASLPISISVLVLLCAEFSLLF